MRRPRTIVFFPEAAYGPALNCVGIAQACRDLGHRPVFVADASFAGVFSKYGFEERLVSLSEPMDAAKASQFWKEFIASHLPHFRLTPFEQLSTYVVPVWEAVVVGHGARRQRLEGDASSEGLVDRLVHDAHPTLADLPDQAVMGEPLTGLQLHRGAIICNAARGVARGVVRGAGTRRPATALS